MKTVSRVILGCKLSSTEQVVKKMLLLKVIGMFWRYRQKLWMDKKKLRIKKHGGGIMVLVIVVVIII